MNKNKEMYKSIYYKILDYDMFDELTEKQIMKKIKKLNFKQVQNFLNLNIAPELIRFDHDLLFNNTLLNQDDYQEKVSKIVSIDNADGWYHLFKNLFTDEFLDSSKFYRDIDLLKSVSSAQIPLWIIGDKTFIDSPYHDDDFKLLISECFEDNNLVSSVIANISVCEDSIKSKYHQSDLDIVIKYGDEALKFECTIPKGSLNHLATNKVSLSDEYHTENMHIIAQNKEIRSYLYAVMTDDKFIYDLNYRKVIKEMIDNKDNLYYVFLLCCYAVGIERAKDAINIIYEGNISWDLEKSGFDIDKFLKRIDKKIKMMDESIDLTLFDEMSTQYNLMKYIKRKKVGNNR